MKCAKVGCSREAIPPFRYCSRAHAPLGSYGADPKQLVVEKIKAGMHEAFEAGRSLPETAKELGLTYRRAHKWAKKLGLEFPDTRGKDLKTG